ADVLFSFEVCYDAKVHPAAQDQLMVDGRPLAVSAPDSHTVVIRLPGHVVSFLTRLAALSIIPRHVLEPRFRQGLFASAYNTATKPESLVTSGPFRLAEYLPNEKTVLSPNPYWFRRDAKGQRIPYLSEVVYLVIPDAGTASLQFQAGQLDAIDPINPA